MAEFDHRSHGWPHARHFVVARRFIPDEEAETTLFTMGRYMFRLISFMSDLQERLRSLPVAGVPVTGQLLAAVSIDYIVSKAKLFRMVKSESPRPPRLN